MSTSCLRGLTPEGPYFIKKDKRLDYGDPSLDTQTQPSLLACAPY